MLVIGLSLLARSLSVTGKSEVQSVSSSAPSKTTGSNRADVDDVSALPFVHSWRGGASGAKKKSPDTHAYAMLGRAVSSRIESLLKDDGESPPEIVDLIQAFRDMSQAQQTFKGLDGAAHEAYQRTHASDKIDVGVSGRALRTAARTGAVADAFGACELCELASSADDWCSDLDLLSSPNGTLANRQVLLNLTNVDGISCGGSKLQVLVLYEASYRGGAGLHHGGIEDLGQSSNTKTHQAKGQILIVLGDRSISLARALKVLSKKPIHVRLSQGRQDETSEAASVQPELYRAASALLLAVEPILRQHNESAVHFVGHSLAGGVASLAATILEGSIPLSGQGKQQTSSPKKNKATKKQLVEDKTNHTEVEITPLLQGLGKGRSSANTLGAPPSISANVKTDFVTSILYGDDIVGRACSESMERFYQRTRKALKKGLFTRQLNRMTDTLSLATSSIKSHAHGSEGEEARLAIAGRAYLVRPRRLGSACSMHEIGASQLKGGREALRAAVLWQLNDILLSKSFWKHHQLDSYIHGLDRVHLRGLEGDHDEYMEQT